MSIHPLQTRFVVGDELLGSAVDVVGLALTAGLLAAVVAAAFQWYTRERLPDGVAVLTGLGVVAVYLNATAALGQVIAPTPDGPPVLTVGIAVQNGLALAAGGAFGAVGGRTGSRLARAFSVGGITELDGDVGRLVRTVGRVVVVELPAAESIDDVDGHDPVPPESKRALGDRTYLLPRGLDAEELRGRLIDRLHADVGVGVVDIDIDAEGTVSYLAVGSRMAGIGPTLPPGMAATAIHADPPVDAGPGDIVQVWESTPEAARVTTAEIRGTAGDVVTLAADETEIGDLSPTDRYRLVTLPVTARADREFARLLRTAEETMGVVTVADGADLVGISVGALEVPVVALRPAEGQIHPLPSRSRSIAAGDTVYAVARPDAIRTLESRAQS